MDTGNRGGQWRYHVGDFRILAVIDDKALIVVALTVGHRSEIY
ncbi:MAG: type II toxin-antitoxin system RelE family toxin [Actinomycetota bacterium]